MKPSYLEVAQLIGSEIMRDAIRYKDRATWMSMIRSNHNQRSYTEEFKSMDGTLYSGTAGIAYFLADLWRFDQNKDLEELILQSLRFSHHTKENVQPEIRLGLYSGWVGILLTSFYAALILESEELDKLSKQLLDELLKLSITNISGLDMIVGAAGAIPALIAIHNFYPSKELELFIHQIATDLLEKSEQDELFIQWETFPGLDHNLTGYAHGAAGFFHAFTELYHWSGLEKYQQIASKIEAYENSHFNQEEKNWPDFRSFDETKNSYNYFCGWCHGAPGIGLSRLRAAELNGRQDLQDQAEAALENMFINTSVEKMGYSLCHGYCGNAMLALDHYQLTQQYESLRFCVELGDELVNHYQENRSPLLNGVGTNYFIPDLMTGTAGIGHFLLRLFDSRIPSILTVDSYFLQKANLEMSVATTG